MMVTEKEKQEMPEVTDGEDELESLRLQNETLKHELKDRDSTILRLEQETADRESKLEALKQTIADAEARIGEVNKDLAQAVAAYKEQVVRGNPGIPADMIAGETVEEVDASLMQALALVEKVRQEMEAEASKMRIPGGAPQRKPMDLSGLSPREKIQYAIGRSS
jgi:multidrug resistance efflux pump